MWKGGEDYNGDGDRVRLFQPIVYGRKPQQNDRAASFVGGSLSSPPPPTCTSCQGSMYLLVQLFVPVTANTSDTLEGVGRTFRVYACNEAACVSRLFAVGPLSYGGEGVIVCHRESVQIPKGADAKASMATTSDKSPSQQQPAGQAWTDDVSAVQHGAADSDDWGEGCMESETDMEAMEAKLAAIETTLQHKGFAQSTRKNYRPLKPKTEASPALSFRCLELHSLQEPLSVVRRDAEMDEDDVGIEGSDDKIQKMLAKYMAEEDDEEILNALRSTPTGCANAGKGGGGRRERDERLSVEDRVFLTYSDRLKRSPRQVLRHAPGGVPLWSV